MTTPGTDTPARGASPEVRTSIFYLSLFASSAAGAVLSGLWLHDRGLTTEQIGLVSAVPLFAMLVLMAIVTTLMASPMFEAFYGRRMRQETRPKA